MAKKEKTQDYKFFILLYPDAEDYDFEEVLNKAESSFQKWAWNNHDKDIDADGHTKKSHVHFVGIRTTEDGQTSPCPISTIANNLGIDERYIRFLSSEKSGVRYLVHADDDDKYQYDLDSICSNYSVTRFFKDRCSNEISRVIYQHIAENADTITVQTLTGWCIQNNLWSEYRRGFAIWNSIIRELKSVG